MADQLTLFENELDAHYTNCLNCIGDSSIVSSWDDYNHRAGYLRAIRDVGLLIKKVRNPEAPVETGEIPSILDEVKNA